MVAPAEVLPAGNEWEFSKRNHNLELRPGRGMKEITNPGYPLGEVVQYVRTRFIRDEWQFAALVQVRNLRIDGHPHLVAIFTHPSRTESLQAMEVDIGQFIKPEAVATSKNSDREYFFETFPTTDPINQILKGTNRLARNIVAGYNGVSVEGRGFWQPGVGFFDIDLWKFDRIIASTDQSIEALMVKVRPLQAEREALLALQSPNPRNLFA